MDLGLLRQGRVAPAAAVPTAAVAVAMARHPHGTVFMDPHVVVQLEDGALGRGELGAHRVDDPDLVGDSAAGAPHQLGRGRQIGGLNDQRFGRLAIGANRRCRKNREGGEEDHDGGAGEVSTPVHRRSFHVIHYVDISFVPECALSHVRRCRWQGEHAGRYG